MFKKNKKKFNNSDVEAQKAAQRQREQIQLRYQIERTKFEIECVELGLEEIAVLHSNEAMIQAAVTLRPFPPQEKEQRIEFLNNKLNDLLVMAGEKEPEQEADKPSSGLVGADGEQLKIEKPQQEAQESDSPAQGEEEEVESDQEPS